MSEQKLDLSAFSSPTEEQRFAYLLQPELFENEPRNQAAVLVNSSRGFMARSDLRLGKDLFGTEREADLEHLRWVERVTQSLEDDYRQLMCDFAGARETVRPVNSPGSSQ